MDSKKIVDLGYEAPDYDAIAVPPSEPKKTKQYPCLYLRDCEDLQALPREGKAVITYKIVGFNDRTGGDMSMDMEVQDIEFTPDAKLADDAGESGFDKNMESAMEDDETPEEEAGESEQEQAAETKSGTEKPVKVFAKNVKIDSSKKRINI